MPKATHYTVVVIGTGFGGTMTALPIAREIVRRNKGEKILMLERGTWWTTPVGTVQDKEVKTYDYLVQKGQPVQFWATSNNSAVSSTSSLDACAGRRTKMAFMTSL